MSKRRERVGKLPPRYKFMLNPFVDTRLSSCPKCERLTYPRKFPLLLHVGGFGLMTLGKTCKYCPRCELIMCHQDELEGELYLSFGKLKPEVIGSEYFVLGTVERKTWKQGLADPRGLTLDGLLEHASDFKKYVDLEFDPGGWRPADAPPRYLEPTPPDGPWRNPELRGNVQPGEIGPPPGEN